MVGDVVQKINPNLTPQGVVDLLQELQNLMWDLRDDGPMDPSRGGSTPMQRHMVALLDASRETVAVVADMYARHNRVTPTVPPWCMDRPGRDFLTPNTRRSG